jgi:mRNA interferase HicA
MKRKELLRHLKAHGCFLFREGGKHSIWWNPTEKKTSSIPRHIEIHEFLARKICRDLGVPEPD